MHNKTNEEGKFPESFECVTGERLEYPIDLVLGERVFLLRLNHEALKSYELKFRYICAQAVNGSPCKNCPGSGNFHCFRHNYFVGSIEPSESRYAAIHWVKCMFDTRRLTIFCFRHFEGFAFCINPNNESSGNEETIIFQAFGELHQWVDSSRNSLRCRRSNWTTKSGMLLNPNLSFWQC